MGYYVIKKSKSILKVEYYFVLRASNGEIIATSEMYTTKESAKTGIRSVQLNGPTTDIRDNT